ncbi:MAG: hypothetical protein HRT45_07095 [Bdellovibrionales bacterium]|nr:hypothetical protein [Bdellovibrionales bacterium]
MSKRAIRALLVSSIMLLGFNATADNSKSSTSPEIFNAKKFIRKMMKERRTRMYKQGKLVNNPGYGPFMLTAEIDDVNHIREFATFNQQGKKLVGFATQGRGLDIAIQDTTDDSTDKTDYKRGQIRIHTKLLGERQELDLQECRYTADGALAGDKTGIEVQSNDIRQWMVYRKPRTLIVINRKIRRNKRVLRMIDKKVGEIEAKIEDLSDSTTGAGGDIVLAAIDQLQDLRDSLLADTDGIRNYMAKLQKAKTFVLANGLFKVRRHPRIRLGENTRIKCSGDEAPVIQPDVASN